MTRITRIFTNYTDEWVKIGGMEFVIIGGISVFILELLVHFCGHPVFVFRATSRVC